MKRKINRNNLPEGFEVKINYDSPYYVSQLEKAMKKLSNYGKKIKMYCVQNSFYTKPSEIKKYQKNKRKRKANLNIKKD